MQSTAEEKISLMSRVEQFLSEKARIFSDKNNCGTSYNIGGNLYQAVSGHLRVRYDFVTYHYNYPTNWKVALEVGNNIKNADSLDLVRSIYKELTEHLTANGADVEKVEHNNSAFVSIGSDKVILKWDYASSFCWIAARLTNK